MRGPGRGGRRVVAAVGAMVAGGLALGACGIPTQQSASPISASQFENRLPASRPAPPCEKGCTPIDVFFIASTGLLTPVRRVVPHDPKLSAVVGSLLAGPTASQHADGIVSALGPDIQLLSDQLTGRNVVTLNFSIRFGTLSGTEEVLGIAQVVYTMNAVRNGVGVIFETNGVTIPVPVATGRLVSGPVHVEEYGGMLTTTVPTTTTLP